MKHKKLLLVSLLLLIFIGSQSVYGQMPDSLEIHLGGHVNKGGIFRTPSLPPVRAFLCGTLLTVNFTSPQPNATITISNALTGEVIYTDVCMQQSTSIDLSIYADDTTNTYIIDVSTPTWERDGEFIY